MASARGRVSRLPPILLASVWMAGTLASFTAMAVAARQLSYHMSTFEIMFFRSVVGLLILLPVIGRRPRAVLRSGQPYLEIARNLVHFAAQYCWILALALLPLADVIALEFTAPIWVTLLAVYALGERLTGPRSLAVVGGFAGILVILRPGVAAGDPDMLIALAAAFGFGISVTMVKALTRTDSPLAIIVYMTIVQLPLALGLALPGWTAPFAADLPWLLLVGGGALGAHYAMARALALADACAVLPIDFLRVPILAVVGYLFYAEPLDPWVLLGAAIIFGANYHVVWRESRPGAA